MNLGASPRARCRRSSQRAKCRGLSRRRIEPCIRRSHRALCRATRRVPARRGGQHFAQRVDAAACARFSQHRRNQVQAATWEVASTCPSQSLPQRSQQMPPQAPRESDRAQPSREVAARSLARGATHAAARLHCSNGQAGVQDAQNRGVKFQKSQGQPRHDLPQSQAAA